ncbi:MAG: hypothetical protein FWH47_02225, partial [Methanomassiliicoccaceae archaeon]|nr:hypothetical protein [Methanomassiliicoccaceae archaeon]
MDASKKVLAVLLTASMMLGVIAVLDTQSPASEGAVGGGALVVTNGGDSGAGSLREAIAAAVDGDTIRFDPSVAAVTLTSGGISFSQSDLTIDGGGGVTIQRAGGSAFRLLDSTAPTGTLTLMGLTLKNGDAGSGDGGGVRVTADAALVDCVLAGNSAGNGGGAYAGGSLALMNCGFEGNTASYGAAYAGSVAADNTTFFSNTITGTVGETGVAVATGAAALRHCTFTDNRQATPPDNVYNVYAGSVTAENCLMTADLLKDNSNVPLGGANLLGTGTDDYAAWFGGNALTSGFIMPLPGVAGGAAAIPGLERDAAGNLRASAGCLFGAVDWTAKSWVVTNSNDSGAGSLRQSVADANADTGAEDWRVVRFADVNTSTGGSAFDIVTGSEIMFSKDVMVYGRLGPDGGPEVTVDATYKTWRVFNQVDSGSSYYYGLGIKNGRTTGSNSGGGIHSNSNVTALHCAFDGNRTGSTGGG